jgi:glycogen phosphorylase
VRVHAPDWLEPFVEDTAFRREWRDIKRNNKARLARYISSVAGVELNPDWMFDVQVNWIHEYKRQQCATLRPT